jgi:hypothetical protein
MSKVQIASSYIDPSTVLSSSYMQDEKCGFREETTIASGATKPAAARPAILRFCHINIELRDSPLGGKGLFAKAPIKKGEIVWKDENCFQTDEVLTFEEIERKELKSRLVFLHFSYQVGENLWSGVSDIAEAEKDASHFYNHSCDPNTWFIDEVTMEARRDIPAGEEITFDYGTHYAFEWPEDIRKIAFPHTIKCLCGSKKCRGKVTTSDWKLPELREIYHKRWIPFIQKWIDEEQANNESK